MRTRRKAQWRRSGSFYSGYPPFCFARGRRIRTGEVMMMICEVNLGVSSPGRDSVDIRERDAIYGIICRDMWQVGGGGLGPSSSNVSVPYASSSIAAASKNGEAGQPSKKGKACQPGKKDARLRRADCGPAEARAGLVQGGARTTC